MSIVDDFGAIREAKENLGQEPGDPKPETPSTDVAAFRQKLNKAIIVRTVGEHILTRDLHQVLDSLIPGTSSDT